MVYFFSIFSRYKNLNRQFLPTQENTGPKEDKFISNEYGLKK